MAAGQTRADEVMAKLGKAKVIVSIRHTDY